VWQTKDFKSNDFGCVARKGVTGGFFGCVATKGVRGLAGYFMGYYTIWLALVKSFFGSVLGMGDEKGRVLRSRKFKSE
jgi:hypothetical protein